ncbi:MAG: 16S rRNA (guanine(966)-N(2))-methyltransferase RsmD [Clostridia bacterium]|nr:16S rRNA (guanine(966)-N(2))-methyltransferase RsmD [Clostridia bacterium]
MMRIITGTARGTKLLTLEGETTRPTTERTKEAVFSMIQFDIEGRTVLDLFAGSGQMALEALSRGAERATLVDQAKAPINIITQNAKKTRLDDRCRIVCADYAEFLRSRAGSERYDLVFLDPPYGDNLLPGALRLLAEKRLLKPGAILVCESSSEEIFGDAATEAKYEVLRRARYGISCVTLLTPKFGDAHKEEKA